MNAIKDTIGIIDQKVSSYCNSIDIVWLQVTFGFVTHMGSGKVCLPIYALLLIFFKKQFSGLILSLIIAEISGLLIIILLRYITKRGRPVPHPKVHILSPWNKYSFPSHHALRSFIIATLAGLSYRVWLPVLLFGAMLISFSRIYLLRHYLSDVFIGAFLGACIAISIKVSGIYV